VILTSVLNDAALSPRLPAPKRRLTTAGYEFDLPEGEDAVRPVGSQLKPAMTPAASTSCSTSTLGLNTTASIRL
jgi:hypothetical protein